MGIRTGARVGTAFMMSKTVEDLTQRRRAFQLWAESSFGLLGRSPDFLNTTVMAFAESPGVFEEIGPRFAQNIRNYYEHVRENDLFLTHALITPQTDRSKGSNDQADAYLHMGVVRETAAGLILRGARGPNTVSVTRAAPRLPKISVVALAAAASNLRRRAPANARNQIDFAPRHNVLPATHCLHGTHCSGRTRHVLPNQGNFLHPAR